MQESYFLNKEAADQEVIKSLLKTVSEITTKFNKLEKRNRKMQLLRNNEGNIVEVVETEEVTREDLVARVDACRESLANAENNLADYDELVNGSQTPVAPVEPQPQPDQPQPAPQPEVVQPEAPQVVEPQPAPAEPVPAEPVAPQPEPIVLG